MKNVFLWICASVAVIAFALVLLASVSYWWFQNTGAVVFLKYVGPVAGVGLVWCVVDASFRQRVRRVFLEIINPFSWNW